MSFPRLDTIDLSSGERTMATACHFIFFFASRSSAERRLTTHPDAMLVSLDEAFAFTQRHNELLFGTELAQRAQASRPA